MLPEFHGTIKTASCINCGEIYTIDDMLARIDLMKTFYVCSICTAPHESEKYINLM